MPPAPIGCEYNHKAWYRYGLGRALCTRRVSDLGSTRATASTSSLFGLPNAALFAIVTRGVFLIRLVFHDPSPVITRSLLPSGTPQIGVGLGRPSLVNVVSSRYFDLMMSWKLAATLLFISASPRSRPAAQPGQQVAESTFRDVSRWQARGARSGRPGPSHRAAHGTHAPCSRRLWRR